MLADAEALYVFGKIDPERCCDDPQEKLSLATGNLRVVNDVVNVAENYVGYAVCTFRGKLYLFGGHDEHEAITDRCVEFDPRTSDWGQMEEMNEMRESPAACPFEERIVVS